MTLLLNKRRQVLLLVTWFECWTFLQETTGLAKFVIHDIFGRNWRTNKCDNSPKEIAEDENLINSFIEEESI